jgi:hypothetical protein
VRRCVRAEPPQRLLELALAADPVPTARLVPRDDDVNQALEEVALFQLGGAPGVLERFVGLEVAFGARKLESGGVRLLDHAGQCYPPGAVATILLCGVDLFFRGKLDALLPGHRLVTQDSVDQPDLVVADIARIDPQEVADAFPDVPIVGFTNHTDTAGLRAAHSAGFDQVLAKSALVERIEGLVGELTGESLDSPA